MSNAARRQAPDPSQLTPGRYRIGEPIGSGSMGTVYRGFDTLTRRELAYKRLRVDRESLRPRLTGLFQREYDTLARLTHPNIVRAYDYGFDELGPYYTMELLSGEDLTGSAPLPYRDACRVLREVASALALVHARRLVHRDVNPNNVRLTETGRAKLIDFGALTPFGTPKEIAGTPTFVAPECLTKTPLDPRADLYSLGALAYWLLTGAQPYRAHTLEELTAAWTRPIAPLTRFVPDLPAPLEELVLSLLQLDRLARPATAADVMERLTTIAELPPEQDEHEVAYSYLEHSPLVGRERQTAQLDCSLARALTGKGELVLIEAAPGVGRTALVDYLAIQAQLAGATVLRTEGGLHEQRFGAARALVEIGVATYPAALRKPARTERGSARPSAFNLPRASTQIEAVERRARIAAGLREQLLAVSRQAPLLVLLDDAQRADGESLALLASLADEIREHPILLVLTRPSEREFAPPDVHAALEASATRIALAPLSEAATMALVQTMFGGVPHSGRVARWAHAESGGVPAQCMDLMRLMLHSGQIRYTRGTFTLPHDVDLSAVGSKDEAQRARLRGVSQSAEMIANLLSLHDGSLTAQELSAASGLEPRNVVLGLQQLIQRGIATAARDAFSLHSESLRGALTRMIAPQTAQVLHTALGRALLDDHGERDLSALERRFLAGYHLLRAGGDRQLEGAQLIANTTYEHVYEVGMSAKFAPLLEAALEVHQRHGSPEVTRLGLLAPLASSGFYGDMEVQRRYLEPTLAAYARLAGFDLASRLERWLGKRLAVTVGIVAAVLRWLTVGGRVQRLRVSKCIEHFMTVASAGIVAAASAFDLAAVRKLVRWLDPIAALPKRSAPALVREFCLATAEIGVAKMRSAAERYARTQRLLEAPVPGLDERVREQMYLGCVHGRAQVLATYSDSAALELARELERGTPYLAPHAETVRLAYHAYRGERALAEAHRARAEALCLRGGLSWTAVTVLNLRWLHMAVLSRDVVGIVRSLAEFERLSKVSASLARIYEMGQAHLLLARGQYESAVNAYAELFDAPSDERRSTDRFDYAMYAHALSELGRHQQAKELCEQLLAELPAIEQRRDPSARLLLQRLALAEAALGQRAQGAQRLEACIAQIAATENPWALGALHRDRAEIALLDGDSVAFARHFRAMGEWFEATENPWLLQQHEALAARAARAGVCAVPIERALPPSAPGATELDARTELDAPALTTRVERRERG